MTEHTEILMIRHGQTAWNKERRLQGHSDTLLNEKGQLQALALAETLRDESLDAIFSSDLQRALQTAKEIAKWHALSVQTDMDLRERSYGALEGMPLENIEKEYPESYAAWHAADPDHVFPPGERIAESLRQFHNRSIQTILRIAERHRGQKIAVVAHFGIIESAYRVAQAIPLGTRGKLPILNTSINRFSVRQDTIDLLKWGDAEHLEPLRKPVDYLKHF